MELEQLDSAEHTAMVETPWDLKPRQVKTFRFTLKGQMEATPSTSKSTIQQFMWTGLRKLDDACTEMDMPPEAISELRRQAFEHMYNISEDIWNNLRLRKETTDEDLFTVPSLDDADFWLSEEDLEKAFIEARITPDESAWSPESEILPSPHCP